MKTLIGNCASLIDWDAVLAEIKTHDVAPYLGNMTLDPTNKYYGDYFRQRQLAEQAGYTKGDSVEFRHYYAGKHYSTDVDVKFGEFVGINPIMSFVSEIRPGKCAPWHWDINPWQTEHEKLGKLQRYLCFINKPKPGHVFMLEDTCFYWEDQGATYQYPSLDAWHAGANAGLEPKFLFTMTGYV
jgi:hypothetical protein